MNSAGHGIGLLLDIALVAGAGWMAVRALAAGLRGLEQVLAWSLSSLLLVAGTGMLLGLAGGLGLVGFLGTHAGVLLGLLVARRGLWSEDLAAFLRLPRELGAELAVTPGERLLLALLGVIAAMFLVLACTAEPVVFDALTYRLSRAGHWLQEGRIAMIATDDERLNYMPFVPDLVTAWLLTGGTAGFALAAVTQAWGGVLVLGATIGLGRLTGLTRLHALAAAALLLGLPNVVPQFTSAYTDLFTTGVLAAGYYLWLAALQRGRGSWPGGAAAALALGAKGTVVYFAPGLALATAWLAWRHRAGVAAWRHTLWGGLAAALVFVLPLLVRNQQAYGYLLGPREFVAWHQGAMPGLAGSAEKLRLNLTSAAAQLCEPNSQPPWWRNALRRAGEGLVRGLPEKDPYAFNDFNRSAQLGSVYALAAPDADVASTGVLLPVLALAALGAAWSRRRTADGELALVWAAMLAAFVLFLHWRLQWHPYLFRFLVLLSPWLAVLAAWWLQLLARRIALVAWVIAGATTLHGLVAGTFTTYQAGWAATFQPGQSTGYYVFAHWREWSRGLDHGAGPLRPALDVNAPLAAFYRQEPPRRVAPGKLTALHGRRAEECVHPGDGWLVAPVAEFFGHEGRVMGRTWLFQGDERHPYSVAAWRALAPGETPRPVLYRDRLADDNHLRREILVRNWDGAPVRLGVRNAASAPARCIFETPLGRMEQELAPGANIVIELASLPDGMAPLTIESAAAGQLEVRLQP